MHDKVAGSRRGCRLCLFAVLAMTLVACTAIQSSPGDPSQPADLATDGSAVVPLVRPATGESTREGLQVEEHELAGPPRLGPLTFEPVQGSQESVLARHAAERDRRLPDRLTFVDENPALWAEWGDGRLLAVL